MLRSRVRDAVSHQSQYNGVLEVSERNRKWNEEGTIVAKAGLGSAERITDGASEGGRVASRCRRSVHARSFRGSRVRLQSDMPMSEKDLDTPFHCVRTRDLGSAEDGIEA